ncbi:unnamed protein product [Lymnaea stagnalis]|uniref:Strictosidine synthase conserved region domain-containing protein n=1 Tax=Lymnaea stagnalis TaxID=6523 RepID=A0AAV2IFZ2_LYMST
MALTRPERLAAFRKMAEIGLVVKVVLVMTSLQPVQNVDIDAVSFQLPSPPLLAGSLETNNFLLDAERVHEGIVGSPSSYVFYRDDIFAVTAGGLVVNVAPCRPVTIAALSPRGCRTVKECGHLISIRLNSDNLLVVLDAYRGLFEVHPVTGVARHLYNSNTLVNGRASVYLNDMVLMQDGTIIVSDSSPTFDFANEFWIRFEGRPDGRLLGYNPVSGQAKEIMSGLAYPTGLEITSDKQALLVAEAGRARIIRVELSKDKFFQKSNFNGNLPGMPEHIRKSKHGTYWVGLTYPRYQGEVSVMDQYSHMATSRNYLAKRRTAEQLIMMYTQRGLAVELDGTGSVLSSLHDPAGLKVKEVVEAIDNDGAVYVAARHQKAVVRVIKSHNDLSAVSAVQVLRSRCRIADDQVSSSKVKMEQEIQNRKSPPVGGQGPVNFIAYSSSDLAPQNFPSQFQQNSGMLPTNRPPTQQAHKPSLTPAAPAISRLETIRMGLSQLHNTLANVPRLSGYRPPGPSGLPTSQPRVLTSQQYPGIYRQRLPVQMMPGYVNQVQQSPNSQNAAPSIQSVDPFLPAGVLANNFVQPLKQIPQSDTSVPGHAVRAEHGSPTSPLVVHRMENGELVTHVLIGNDFKIPDQRSTTTRPPVQNNVVVNQQNIRPVLPTLPTAEKNPHVPPPNPTSPKAPPTFNTPPPIQDLPGTLGGFFDLIHGSSHVKKDVTPPPEPTPGAPLPDHGALIHAGSPYFPGASHSEAHNNTPSDLGLVDGVETTTGAAQKRLEANPQDISSKAATDVQQMQMFHPSERAEAMNLAQNNANPKASAASPVPGRASFLKQGLQMLQQYFKHAKSTPPPLLVPEDVPTQTPMKPDGILKPHETPGQVDKNQNLREPNAITTSSPLGLDKQKDQEMINGMIKRDQMASFSGAATIHPNQPLNDVAVRESQNDLQAKHFQIAEGQPLSLPPQSPQPLHGESVPSPDEGSYIKIVQGPGKYILIPLTQSTLMQALGGVSLNNIPNRPPQALNSPTANNAFRQTTQPNWMVPQNPEQYRSPNGPTQPVPNAWGANTPPPGANFQQSHPPNSAPPNFHQLTIPTWHLNQQQVGSSQPGSTTVVPMPSWQNVPTSGWPLTQTNNAPTQQTTYNMPQPLPGSNRAPQAWSGAQTSASSTMTTPQQSWQTSQQGRTTNGPSQNPIAVSSPQTRREIDPTTQTSFHSNTPANASEDNSGSSQISKSSDPTKYQWQTNNTPPQNWPTINPSTQGWPTNNPQTQAWPTNGPPTQAWPINGPPTQAWPINGQTANSWPTNNPQSQSWPTNSQPAQSWSTNNPIQSWPTNSPQTQSWPTNSPTTQSWPTNSPPTQSWPTNSPQTPSWPTNSPTAQPWPSNSPQTQSWPNNSPPTQSWPSNSPSTQSWPTNSPQTQSWPTNSPTTQSWPTNSLQTQSWPTNSPTTQSWPSNSPSTQSWTTNSQQTQLWPTNNPTTQQWPTNGPSTQSWPTNSPQTQSWPTNNPTIQSWPTNSPTTQQWPTNNPSTQSWPANSTPNQSFPFQQSWSTSNSPTETWPKTITQTSTTLGYNQPGQSSPPQTTQHVAPNSTSIQQFPTTSSQLPTAHEQNNGSYVPTTVQANDATSGKTSQQMDQTYVTQWQASPVN